jgi:hypothetical protein
MESYGLLDLANYEIDERPYCKTPAGTGYRAKYIPDATTASIFFKDPREKRNMGNVVIIQPKIMKWPSYGMEIPLHWLWELRADDKYQAIRCVICPRGRAGRLVCGDCGKKIAEKERDAVLTVWLLGAIGLGQDVTGVIVPTLCEALAREKHVIR